MYSTNRHPENLGTDRSLEVQRLEFSRSRFLAMPLAGAIAWIVVGLGGLLLGPVGQVWTLFIATGMIVFLGLQLSKLTGEHLTAKDRPRNTFDRLFFTSLAMALLVYAIAIPFFLVDYTSLPLTVGILTGLMWLPLSWIIQHWVGWFHGVTRTLAVTAAWFVFPEQRFVVIPFLIVVIYAITIVVLEQRWRQANMELGSAAGGQ